VCWSGGGRSFSGFAYGGGALAPYSSFAPQYGGYGYAPQQFSGYSGFNYGGFSYGNGFGFAPQVVFPSIVVRDFRRRALFEVDLPRVQIRLGRRFGGW